jgi:hypothetical protein
VRAELEHVAAAERSQGPRKRSTKVRAKAKDLREGPSRCVDARKNAGSVSRPGDRRDRAYGCVGRIEERACGLCGRLFQPGKPWQRFCGQGCRRLFSAAEELFREYSAGRAPGIRPIVERLKLC